MAKKSSEKTATKKQEVKARSGKEAKEKNEKAVNEEVELKEEVKEEKNAEPSAEEKFEEIQDRYLRLSAEFDNYRKRTLREKTDLLKSAGESTILKFIPVMDDFERAMISIQDAKDINAVKKGVELIFTKLKDALLQQGVKEIEALHQDFNTDLHEAVTKIPAPQEDLKGKVVDVIEKGYILNDKVIRFSKVVIGE